MSAELIKQQKENEKKIAKFHYLRNEQRTLANKLTSMEMDLKEHNTVIETLKLVEEDRKCFRLIGGVLCERTVKEVLPQLIEHKQFLQRAIDIATAQLTQKGIEVNKYKEEHNIKIRGQEPDEDDNKSSKTDESGAENRNVLVAN